VAGWNILTGTWWYMWVTWQFWNYESKGIVKEWICRSQAVWILWERTLRWTVGKYVKKGREGAEPWWGLSCRRFWLVLIFSSLHVSHWCQITENNDCLNNKSVKYGKYFFKGSAMSCVQQIQPMLWCDRRTWQHSRNRCYVS